MAANTPFKSLGATLLFILTGLVPFLVGTLLAGVAGFPVHWGIFLGGSLALAALILAAGGSRLAFAPAEGRWPGQGLLAPGAAQTLAYAGVGLAAVLGLILQFGAHTGPWTIPLGGYGILCSYFYFAPPCKWHQRGLGEFLSGLCFGLLPVGAGLYLQTGHLLTEVLVYGLPLSCTGFNLLLIHGFPHPGEEAPGPRHGLAAKVGPVAGALIYTLMNILTIAALVFALLFPANPLPFRSGFILLIILAVINQELIKRKDYLREAGIDRLCRLTLAQHLALGLVCVISLWRRW
ncbi:MAG: prenyltransferase [Thermodesulfobacteriota bacterium]